MATAQPEPSQPADERSGRLPPAPSPLRVPVTDSHCHLDIVESDVGLSVADGLARAREVGVTQVVQVGVDVPSSLWSVRVAHSHPSVVAAVAVHPNEAPVLAGRARLEDALREIDRLAADPRVRAVGETGLDHYRTGADGHAAQEHSFRRHIAIARRHGKALVIHDRDAHDDVLRVLADEELPPHVVFHCFSGDAAMARLCVEHGHVLSFAGNVTFKSAEGLREALRVTPLTSLLVETDAPFLTPVPLRGHPNASYLVPHTIRAIAQVKGLDEDDVASAVAATTERVFGPW